MRTVDTFPYAVREIEHRWIPMADGCRLAARMWIPQDAWERPVPAVLEIIPYRKRAGTRWRDEPMHRWLAGHGVAAVRVDVRGSGDSDGVLEDEYSAAELADAEAVIAWLAAEPWCSGRVGLVGKSWGGIVALAVAARRPPALGAVVTVCSSDDRYRTDAHYMGGCLLAENLLWGSSLTTLAALPPDPALVGDGWRATWERRLAALRPFAADWMRHPRRDATWRRASVGGELDRVACPVFAVGGWADAYTDTVFRLLTGLAAPRRAVVGPWAHLYPHDADPGPEIGFLQECLAWWRRWLVPHEAPEDDDHSRLVAWMPERVPPGDEYPEGPGRWVGEEAWPSPRLARRVLYLAGEALRPAPASDAAPRRIASPQTVGAAAGRWCAFGDPHDAPGDQGTDDAGSLCFESAPLVVPLELLGQPAVTLELAADRPRALLAVRLVDVAPDGSAARVAYTVRNLAHADDHVAAASWRPGERFRLRLELGATAWSLPAGHRLRLALSTAYWPLVWPSPEPVTLTVFPAASRLELPVRPPRPADADLRPFAPAEGAATDAAPPATASRRWTTGDPAGIFEIHEVAGETADGEVPTVHVPGADLDVGGATSERYRIDARDPLGAEIEVRHRRLVGRPGWRTAVATRWRLTADADTFRLEGAVDATLDGETVAARRWDERIPRDLL